MRLIDAEPIEQALFKLADKSLAKNPYENARVCAFRRAFELILGAPTITPPPNDPLTLEELRNMDGEPVWVHIAGSLRWLADADGVWGLVDVDDSAVYFDHKEGIAFSKIAGLAYRRKPEEG